MKWTENESYLHGVENYLDKLPDPIRVAGFDLDDTLIYRPKKRQDTGDADWRMIDKSIPEKIAELVSKKYIIVIFSNQGGMSISKNFDIKRWKKSVEKLVKKLFSQTDIPYYFVIYTAKTYDLNRKPNLGMWNQMKKNLAEEFRVNKVHISTKSFFCGDAAGRTKPGTFKKKIYPTSVKGDFSDTDRKFALNIGIKFYTPEELFLGEKSEAFVLSGFNPQKFLESYKKTKYKFEPREQELLVMVGPPGAGKTEFVKKYILPQGYVHINQDTCKTKKKCLELAEKAMKKKQSIVIDSTNPDVLSRMAYTSLTKKKGYDHIRAIVLTTPIEMAKHLNNVRHVYSKGNVPKISDMVYNIFKKNYVEPVKKEHFDLIEKIDLSFNPEWLEDDNWKKIFMKWS